MTVDGTLMPRHLIKLGQAPTLLASAALSLQALSVHAGVGPRQEEQGDMAELVRTNDPALLSVIEGLLSEERIPHHIADRHASSLDGSTEVIKQRVLVPDERESEARALLTEADLGEWLRPRHG